MTGQPAAGLLDVEIASRHRQQGVVAGRLGVFLPGQQFLLGSQRAKQGVGHAEVERRAAAGVERAETGELHVSVGPLVGPVVMRILQRRNGGRAATGPWPPPAPPPPSRCWPARGDDQGAGPG